MGRMELPIVFVAAFMLASNIPHVSASLFSCNRPLEASIPYTDAIDFEDEYPMGSNLTISCKFSDMHAYIYCDLLGLWMNRADDTIFIGIPCPSAVEYCGPPTFINEDFDQDLTYYKDKRDRYPNKEEMTMFCRYSANKARIVCDGAVDGGVWRFVSPSVHVLDCLENPVSGGFRNAAIYGGVFVGLTVFSAILAFVVRSVRACRENDEYPWTRF
ncbi:uncharacterized protein [Diadema antillarum]|uniref:uncharacterized protein n=1 Tax=Diadema antillarum TaxID=105358 RepID=UPI003A8BEEE4